MNESIMPKVLIRLCLIAIWIGGITLFLYTSKFIQIFQRKKTLNIFSWAQVLDGEFLGDFEKQTGIKINISYFERNEELFVKLRTTAKHDYDIIMPSDYAAEIMIKEGLIKKIDRSRLVFFDQLYPALLGHYFDPNNEYTIPFYWSILGLGIDKDYFGGKIPESSWALVFDENSVPERISVLDVGRELPLIAAQYLFGRIENLTNDEIEKIKQLLIRQRRWVEIYTDFRPEFILASKTCPVAIVLGMDLLKVMRRFENIEFIIPKEGGFVILDSIAIPAATTKDDLIYQFLNYLYQPDVLRKYVEKYEFSPTVQTIEIEDFYRNITVPTQNLFKQLYFFKNVISEDVLNDLWVTLKG